MKLLLNVKAKLNLDTQFSNKPHRRNKINQKVKAVEKRTEIKESEKSCCCNAISFYLTKTTITL